MDFWDDFFRIKRKNVKKVKRKIRKKAKKKL